MWFLFLSGYTRVEAFHDRLHATELLIGHTACQVRLLYWVPGATYRFLPLKTSIRNASPIIYTRSVYSKVVLKKNHLLWDSCQLLIHLFQTTYRPPCRNPKKLLPLQSIKLLQPGFSSLISLTWYKELVLHCIKCLAIYNNIYALFPGLSRWHAFLQTRQRAECIHSNCGFQLLYRILNHQAVVIRKAFTSPHKNRDTGRECSGIIQ